MYTPNKPTLVRTRNYIFQCGHIFGFPINQIRGKLCPKCVMNGRLILKYFRKYKKKNNIKKINIFNNVFFENTNTSSYKNIDNIVKKYL